MKPATQKASYNLGRYFNSYTRTEALVSAMYKIKCPVERLELFLYWGNTCDAPWPWRNKLAELLRISSLYVDLADVLKDESLELYDELPEIIPIWRGCEGGRERGLHWTTDGNVAVGFGRGKRCTNANPTLVRAAVQKEHILAVFADREESEIVVDPRRLRQFRVMEGMVWRPRDEMVTA